MKIALIGYGNVGSHLSESLKRAGHQIDVWSAREIVDCPDKISICIHSFIPEIILIAVQDKFVKQISELISEYSDFTGIVAHTSGSLSIDRIVSSRRGVFYPLQTFSIGVEMQYERIPFLIEGEAENAEESAGVVEILMKLAQTISGNVIYADSQIRKAYHLASVIACNFVNYLWGEAWKYLEDNGLRVDILFPLIEQTLRKAESGNPKDFQTGPAVREDLDIIDQHLEMLEDNTALRKIYQLMSESIMQDKLNNK